MKQKWQFDDWLPLETGRHACDHKTLLRTSLHHETNYETTNLSGNTCVTLGVNKLTSPYRDHVTASLSISDWGSDTLMSSWTDSHTMGTSGLTTGGTIVVFGWSSRTSSWRRA